MGVYLKSLNDMDLSQETVIRKTLARTGTRCDLTLSCMPAGLEGPISCGCGHLRLRFNSSKDPPPNQAHNLEVVFVAILCSMCVCIHGMIRPVLRIEDPSVVFTAVIAHDDQPEYPIGRILGLALA
jgi:hypothetical protein